MSDFALEQGLDEDEIENLVPEEDSEEEDDDVYSGEFKFMLQKLGTAISSFNVFDCVR